jgi:hypothetical protein
MAGATREGDYQCQPWWCAARGCSAGVPPVDKSFPSRVPSHCWNGAAQMAVVASHRGCQAEAARWPIIAIGCGLGVRLQRSEPPHASLQPIGWHKSGRMASGARRIASRDSRRARTIKERRCYCYRPNWQISDVTSGRSNVSSWPFASIWEADRDYRY